MQPFPNHLYYINTATSVSKYYNHMIDGNYVKISVIYLFYKSFELKDDGSGGSIWNAAEQWHPVINKFGAVYSILKETSHSLSFLNRLL